jgi:hypothetical protein
MGVENIQRWEYLKKPKEIISDLDASSFISGISDNHLFFTNYII